jgi:hypothetical protein
MRLLSMASIQVVNRKSCLALHLGVLGIAAAALCGDGGDRSLLEAGVRC